MPEVRGPSRFRGILCSGPIPSLSRVLWAHWLQQALYLPHSNLRTLAKSETSQKRVWIASRLDLFSFNQLSKHQVLRGPAHPRHGKYLSILISLKPEPARSTGLRLAIASQQKSTVANPYQMWLWVPSEVDKMIILNRRHNHIFVTDGWKSRFWMISDTSYRGGATTFRSTRAGYSLLSPILPVFRGHVDQTL